MLGVSVIFLCFFANWRLIAFVMIPLSMAVLWTLGTAAALYGRLTLITVCFVAIVVGLGVDFAIHIVNHWELSTASGKRKPDALKDTFLGVGRGVFYGAVTSSMAFFALCFAVRNDKVDEPYDVRLLL